MEVLGILAYFGIESVRLFLLSKANKTEVPHLLFWSGALAVSTFIGCVIHPAKHSVPTSSHAPRTSSPRTAQHTLLLAMASLRALCGLRALPYIARAHQHGIPALYRAVPHLPLRRALTRHLGGASRGVGRARVEARA